MCCLPTNQQEPRKYTGRMIEELIQMVERVRGPIQRTGDAFLDLAQVKTALADKPMTGFDEVKWWKADRLQSEIIEHSLSTGENL